MLENGIERSETKTVGSFLRREPLVHFIALAALLFALDGVWSATKKEAIVVDSQTAEFLFNQREELLQRELRPEERQKAIDAFLEDEILYREANKQDLDKGDSRIRRNLILKMRGLLTANIEEPSEEQLEQYFEANRERYAPAGYDDVRGYVETDWTMSQGRAVIEAEVRKLRGDYEIEIDLGEPAP